jgi:hypothetical protein
VGGARLVVKKLKRRDVCERRNASASASSIHRGEQGAGVEQYDIIYYMIHDIEIIYIFI